MENPLIGLGFADTRDEIQEMIDEVDEDASGMIEFDEFLLIIKNSDKAGKANEKTAKINKFFKDVSNNVLGSKELSFNIIVQNIRRQYMMDALMCNNPDRQAQGERILKNVNLQHR